MENQENEITILTKEEINALDKNVNKFYVGLEERLPAKKLTLLNPVISELISFQKFRDIKYDLEKKDESIQLYKNAKAELRSFAKKIGDVKKLIKGPIDEAGKMIVSIEKACIDIKNSIDEDLTKNFEAYEKEKADKAAELQAKKDKEKNDMIEKLSEENSKNLSTHIKGQLIQRLKFESLEPIEQLVTLALENYTAEKIGDTITALETQSWDSILVGVDTSILEEQELEDCKKRYETQMTFFINSLNARKSSLLLTQEKQVTELAVEQAKGMKAINVLAPEINNEQERTITPTPVQTQNVPMPVPVKIPVPVEVNPGVLSLNTVDEHKKALLDLQVKNIDSLQTLYDSCKRHISVHSSEEDKTIASSIHGALTMAKKSNEWVTKKLNSNV